jgi:hypothetical protein
LSVAHADNNSVAVTASTGKAGEDTRIAHSLDWPEKHPPLREKTATECDLFPSLAAPTCRNDLPGDANPN